MSEFSDELQRLMAARGMGVRELARQPIAKSPVSNRPFAIQDPGGGENECAGANRRYAPRPSGQLGDPVKIGLVVVTAFGPRPFSRSNSYPEIVGSGAGAVCLGSFNIAGSAIAGSSC